ncbi:hypothetical protein ACWDRR_36675 [Kitasatospora sp. NPDC003701]
MTEENQADPRFEDALGNALSTVGQSFRPATGPRLDKIATRGRTLRRRRMAVLTGSVAAVAVVGVGGVFAVGLGGPARPGVLSVAADSTTVPPTLAVSQTTDARPTQSNPDAQPTQSTQSNSDAMPPSPEAQPGGDEVLTVVAALLPSGLAAADATTDKGFARFNVDDGNGKGEVQVYVAKQPAGAPDPRYDHSTALPDGSRLVVQQAPASGSETVRWSADILHPDGTRVVVQAYNTAVHDNTGRTKAGRPTPSLTLDQIRAIATNPIWQQHNGKK